MFVNFHVLIWFPCVNTLYVTSLYQCKLLNVVWVTAVCFWNYIMVEVFGYMGLVHKLFTGYILKIS